MFKNIFSEHLNRLVFRGPDVQPEVEAEKDIKDAQASPEALRQEAAELAKAVNSYVDGIQKDINHKRGILGQKPIKIDLSKPESYAELESDRGLWSVVESMAEAMKELKRPNPSRGDLDFVRVKIKAAEEFYRNDVFDNPKGDPLTGLSMAEINVDRIAKAQPKDTAREIRESRETTGWVRIARLVDEYNKLGQTADDKARQRNIQGELLTLTSEMMKGKPNAFTMTNVNLDGQMWNVKVDRAPGAGTEAFRLTMVMPTRTLAQGGRPEARTVRYQEKPVFAGGSEKDFPTT